MPSTWTVAPYERIGLLPPFNPDDDGPQVHEEVTRLRRTIGEADAIVMSTPEYAHALPGSFKNALDWLVSDPAFAGKTVVILHVARGTHWAVDSLREVLATMSACLLPEASVDLPLGSNTLDEDAILARTDLRSRLEHSIEALKRATGTGD
jgi:NAD(P)H-dependent FMN reductase